MAGAGQRRRFPNRQVWIRRRTWSKQRGAKLRSSSSESEGNPHPVVKLLLRDGDAASKLALKVGGGGGNGTRSPKLASSGHNVSPKRVVEVGDRGDGGSCGPNTGTYGCDGSPRHIVEVGGDGDDVSYSPVLGCCSCNPIRKHLAVEEGGCEGTCTLKLGICDCDGSPKHTVEMGLGDGIEHVRDGRNVRGRRIGRGRLRADPKGQLYVLDSEAEDSDLEESCRPVLRRGQGAFGHRLAANDEMVQCMECWLTGIEEANREVFIPWIKVFLFTALLKKIQIKGMANIMNCCILKEASRFSCSLLC